MDDKKNIDERLELVINDQIDAVEVANDKDRSARVDELKTLMDIRAGSKKAYEELKEKRKDRWINITKWAISIAVLVGLDFVTNAYGYGFDYEAGLTSDTFRNGKKKMSDWKTKAFGTIFNK